MEPIELLVHIAEEVGFEWEYESDDAMVYSLDNNYTALALSNGVLEVWDNLDMGMVMESTKTLLHIDLADPELFSKIKEALSQCSRL